MKRLLFATDKGYSLQIITAILVFFFTDQLLSQSSENSIKFPEFEQYNRNIVAKIGDIELTAQEFLFNYEFGPAFLKRTAESKKKYLDLMIYEKLLAIDGYRQGMHQKESVIRSLKAYEEDIVTEELFKAEVMNQVFVTDEEIERAIPFEQKKITLRWLYADQEDEMTNQWNALTRGAAFDSLFARQLNDSVFEDDRSMQTSLYRLNIKNPALATIIDTLSASSITNPIRVTDGWYIVKIDNIRTDLITTETELQKLKHELERSIYKQKLDVVSDMYVKELMDNHSPEINRDTFREVVYYINQVALYPDSFDRRMLNEHLGVGLNEKSESSSDVSGKSDLVHGKSCQIVLDEFIDWYRPRMAYLKFPANSVKDFILAVQRTVWRMVRDFLLVQKARTLNLDQSAGVKAQVQWWQDKIVYNAVKAEIAASITFNENDLHNFYNANLRDYRYKDGTTIPFEKARRNVQSDYVREKYMTRLMQRVIKLKKIYDIQINDAVLAGIEVEDEADPKAIDFYAVKKGGLLPRQPFPTIDWEWQLWY